jgi:lipoprotein signal peptidase
MKFNTKILFLSFFLIAVDQIWKFTVSSSFCNKNLAWSLPLPGGFFYVAWAAIVTCLIYIFAKSENNFQKISLIFIFSGAISNFIDRLRLGCVMDYIDLKFWPVFNLADVYITVGLLLYVLIIFKLPNTKR